MFLKKCAEFKFHQSIMKYTENKSIKMQINTLILTSLIQFSSNGKCACIGNKWSPQVSVSCIMTVKDTCAASHAWSNNSLFLYCWMFSPLIDWKMMSCYTVFQINIKYLVYLHPAIYSNNILSYDSKLLEVENKQGTKI